MDKNSKGYFIFGIGEGGAEGPLRKPSLTVDLVYGIPVTKRFGQDETVRTIEKSYGLLRYFNSSIQDLIYVVRFPVEEVGDPIRSDAMGIPATPELHRIFDELVPKLRREVERFEIECCEAYERGMKKAGLTKKQEKMLREEDSKNGTCRYYNEFYLTIVKHIKNPPRNVLVKVEGIDDILEQIEIS